MPKLPKIAALWLLAAPALGDTQPIALPVDPTGGTLIAVCQQTGTQVAMIEGDGVAGAVTGDVSAGSWYATDAALAAATPDLPAGGPYSFALYENDTAGGVTPGGADDTKIVGYIDGFYWSGTAAYDPTSTIYPFAVDMEPIIEDIQNTTSFLPTITAGQAGGLFIAGANAATTVDFTGSLSGSVGSVTGAVGSVTGNVGGISGTITTLDALDTAQDAQHTATMNRLGAPVGADLSADVAAVKAETATIVTDTNELQTDWVNGGRLDLLLDSTITQTAASAIRTALGMAAADLDTQLDNIFAGDTQPISPDRIVPSRTWIADGYRARNIVEVADNFIGTFSLKPDLNPATSILTVASVSITGAATVTATDLAPTADKLYANFTVPSLTTTGTYTVVVTVTTTDGQTVPTTATLKVY